jgi:tRNA (adenine22-N1)-methyltransferase
MKLAKRLQSISSFVSPNAVLVDVGCDHGWLGIYLLENEKVKYVYGSDIAQGPLDNVRRNIDKYQVNKQMEAVLSDGLNAFEDITFTDAVIAGMGGSLIIEILDKNLGLLKDKNLVLQPNVNVEGLRRYLLKHGFTIIDEAVVSENDISYNIINAQKKSDTIINDYQPIEITYGRHNLINNEPLTIKMMEIDYAKYQGLLDKVVNNYAKHDAFRKNMDMIEEYLDGIK